LPLEFVGDLPLKFNSFLSQLNYKKVFTISRSYFGDAETTTPKDGFNDSQLLYLISLSLIFGILGFLYSFFGLFEQTKNRVILEPFHALTMQEVGGHFLFGFIVGIAVRSLMIAILPRLMALAIDSSFT